MPLATERHHQHEPDRAPPVAPGLDDDRGAAHRASMAGLRREAAQLGPPSVDDQRRQHDKADAASFQALESSMALVCAKLFASSHDIERLVAAPRTDAGVSPILQTVEALIRDRMSDLASLDHHLALVSHADGPNYGMTSFAHMLDRQLGGLYVVADMFKHAVDSARALAGHDGLPFKPKLDPMMNILARVGEKIGKPAGEAITSRTIETRSEASVRTEAIDANVHAVVEAARAVRVQARGKEQRTAEGDLQNMLRHVAELDTLVGQLTDRQAVRKVAPRVRQALHEVAEVGPAVANTPGLDLAFRGSAELPMHLRSLHAKVG